MTPEDFAQITAIVAAAEQRTSAHIEAVEQRTTAHIDAAEQRTTAHIDTVEERTTAHIDTVEERLNARIEHVETSLLTEFHKWASPADARAKSHAAAIRAIDAEMEFISERVTKLEGKSPQ